MSSSSSETSSCVWHEDPTTVTRLQSLPPQRDATEVKAREFRTQLDWTDRHEQLQKILERVSPHTHLGVNVDSVKLPYRALLSILRLSFHAKVQIPTDTQLALNPSVTESHWVAATPTTCHANITKMLEQGAIATHMIGIALFGGLWRIHSWGVLVDGTIVESTPPVREAYIGIDVSRLQSEYDRLFPAPVPPTTPLVGGPCASCGKLAKNHCTSCLSVHYCHPICQAEHMGNHIRFCREQLRNRISAMDPVLFAELQEHPNIVFSSAARKRIHELLGASSSRQQRVDDIRQIIVGTVFTKWTKTEAGRRHMEGGPKLPANWLD